MKNLTESEVAKLKDILFKWVDSDNLQEWVNAVNALIKLGEISTQEAQSQAIAFMEKAMKAIDDNKPVPVEIIKPPSAE
ncbi:hypothetical protein LCGC14_2789960 [marine sediment metagenome]|uniref:Uncharacterized protein n=1 Tax=marine sediment metagenome TaxID=412755 RepID=A0A0F8YQT5_9ZZZZ